MKTILPGIRFNSKHLAISAINVLMILGITLSLGSFTELQGQTYGPPCFTENFGTVPSGQNADTYRGEITGRGEMGMAFWFWPFTCSGTGYISVNYDSAMSNVADTMTLPPREPGYTNWYFIRVTELMTGAPYNGANLNNPANTWCLYQSRPNIASPWSWTFSGPNTVCPTPSNLIRHVHPIRWYNRGGTWMLGNYQRKIFKRSVPCASWNAQMDDGGYCLSANPNWAHNNDGAWLPGPDHTPGDVNGMMLVVNAAWEKGQFFKRSIPGLCYESQFEFKAYYANILSNTGGCNSNRQPINIRFEVWDRNPGDDEANALVSIGGSAVNGAILLNANNTGNIAATNTLVWHSNTIIFNVPANQDEVFIVLRNNGNGGCGNDLAIDDITFSPYLPFTLDYSIDLNNYCVSNQVILEANRISGTIPPNFFFQWQEALVSSSVWTNIGIPVNDINLASITLDVNDISTKKFRILSASSVQNFNNSNCYVASSEFFGSSIQLPTATVTGVSDVCGTIDHQPRAVSLSVNYQGNVYPWTYYYSIDGAPEVSVTVPAGNTDIVNFNITDNASFELLRVKTNDCVDPLPINQVHTIQYSIALPGTPSSIAGPNPACIGSIGNFSIPPVAGTVYYHWIVSNGWSVISGQGTPNTQLHIGSTPIYVEIQTNNACGTSTWQSELFSTTYDVPAAPSDITAPDLDCITPFIAGNSDIIFEASSVAGASAYYWEWDPQLSLGIQQPGTGQYLQRIVLSVPNNVTSFYVRVRAQNNCGFSTTREVTFTTDN